MNRKMIGRIIRTSRAGWGFISTKEIPFVRVFFHWTELRQDSIQFLDLRPGMAVEFTPVEVIGRGWRAIHVRAMEREEYEQRKSDLPPLQKRESEHDGETDTVDARSRKENFPSS